MSTATSYVQEHDAPSSRGNFITRGWNNFRNKTIGEHGFNFLTYGVINGVGTLITSVGLAVLARDVEWFGKQQYMRAEDALTKRYEKSMNPELLKQNPDAARGRAKKTLLVPILGTGGTLFVIPTHWMESRKREIVHAINKRFGGDVEKGDQQVQNEPMPGWKEFLLSRAAAFASVYVSFEGIYATQKGRDFMDRNEKKWGHWADDNFGRLAKSQKAAAIPNNDGQKPKTLAYKIGKLTFDDLFATIMATGLLFSFSKLFSRNKHTRAQEQETDKQISSVYTAPARAETENEAISRKSYTANTTPREKIQPRGESYGEYHQQARESSSAQVVGV